MLRSILLVALALISLQAKAEEASTILPRNLLIVSDMEASKRFYAYALGYEITRDAPITQAVSFQHLGIPDTHSAQIVVLKPRGALAEGEQQSATIALLQVTRPPLGSNRRDGHLATGQVVLAMRTDDIEGVIVRLRELGATFAVEPVRTPDGLVELAVLDPDGIRIQINQWPRQTD